MGVARPQNDGLAEVERNRLRLEENITKLRISLQHWQTWEAEYEGLQEEIKAFEGEPTTEDLMEIGRNFGSDLVNEREIMELVNYGKSTQRTGKQVVELLSRRIDYVQQNIRTIRRRVDVVEEKLSSLPAVTIPEMQSDEGLPMTEIHEELDEEGNVLSSTISHPGQAAPEIVQALRQAGVTDLETPELNEGPLQYKVGADGSREDLEQAKTVTAKDSETARPAPPEPSPKQLLDSSSQAPAKAPKKSVAFAETTKAPAPVPIPIPTAPSGSASYRLGPELAKGSFHKGSRVIELDENDQEIGSTPVIPLDESPGDAARRREMLEYSLSEVGAVVAELGLEDVDGESSYDDDDYEIDEGDWEDESEEDEHGRSLRPGISDEYRQEMLELEKKLNAKMLENVGPRPNDPVLEEAVKSAHRLVVQKDKPSTETPTQPTVEPKTKPAKKNLRKKGVRFADELDISSAPTPAPKAEPPVIKNLIEKPVVSDIIERSSANAPPPSTEPPKKTSRFKATRAPAPPPAPPSPSFTIPDRTKPPVAPPTPTPSFAPNEILTPSILERPPSSTSTSTKNATAPDENALDPALLQRETAAAYHKMRNRMIQQQGGFLASERERLEEEERGPLLEERDGKVRKVSRFRAARLGGGGV